MREILFRAKAVSNKQWVRGSLLKDEKGMCYVGTYLKIEKKTGLALMAREQGKTHNRFVGMGFVQVDPETVCQFTGMTDKNGVQIFEGDIVEFKRINAMGWTQQRTGDVRYYDELPIFYIMAITGDAWDWCDCFDIEVVGNIFDDPEFLKGEQ